MFPFVFKTVGFNHAVTIDSYYCSVILLILSDNKQLSSKKFSYCDLHLQQLAVLEYEFCLHDQ